MARRPYVCKKERMNQKYRTDIGYVIRSWRAEGLSDAQIAMRLERQTGEKVSTTTVRRWEQGLAGAGKQGEEQRAVLRDRDPASASD